MNENIKEIAERLRGLREIMEFSVEEMAEATNVSPEEYALREAGEKDFSVTFLGKCADKFGVDIIDLLSGSGPRLPVGRKFIFSWQNRPGVLRAY